MKRFALFIGIAAGLVASCSIQEDDIKTPQEDDVIYYASFEQPAEDGTRVYANEDLLLRWTADDRVSIFGKNTYNQQYKFLGETGDNSGGFSKVAGAEYVTGNPLSHTVSVYPYQASTKITEGEVLTITLPAEQHYAENTFGLGANTMVSVTADDFLQYKNVGGYLVLKLYGEGVSISSITLKGNNGEKLAGKATVTMPLDGVPTAALAEDATDQITLVCDTPVALGATAEESTEFWLVVPPTTFSKGFTLTVRDKAKGFFEKSTDKPLDLSRNMLSKMAALDIDIDTTSPVESTLAEIACRPNGTPVKTNTVQVMAKTLRGFILADDTRTMFLYSMTDIEDIAVGDIIQVTSTFTHYRDLPELSGIDAYTCLSSGNTPSYPSPTDITARSDFDDDFFKDFQYISLTGSLESIRTNHIGNSFFVERSADDEIFPFNIFYPYDYQDTDGYSIGDAIRAEGYFAGFNSSDICIIITSMTAQHQPEAVDLGLPSGLKWASYNLGASKPEEYGDYYAWGETEPYYSSLDPLTWKEGKENGYGWPSYRWCNGSVNTLTKYCNDSSCGYNGFTDDKTVLDPEDDAAHVNLGGNWRMPTYAEGMELIENCIVVWVIKNGVRGLLFTARNGNSIFLPESGSWAGVTYRSVPDNGNYSGYYMTSTLSSTNARAAMTMLLVNEGVHFDGMSRVIGKSIRPVYAE